MGRTLAWHAIMALLQLITPADTISDIMRTHALYGLGLPLVL